MSADLALAILDQQPDGDLLAEVSATKPEEIRRLVPELLRSTQKRLWLAALLIERVEREELFRAWADSGGRHYVSTADWASHELGYHKSTTSRYLTSARDLRDMPQEERERWVDRVSPFRLHAVHDMVKSDRDGAFELAISKRTDGQVRQTVKESQPDQHWDTSGLRTLKILYPASLRDMVVAVFNRARFEAHKREPSDADLLEWILTTVRNEPLAPELAPFLEVIERGEFRCRNCGSWDAREIERHHVRARSAGGHDGPIALLCRPCHAAIQPRWREWAKEQGYPEEVWKA